MLHICNTTDKVLSRSGTVTQTQRNETIKYNQQTKSDTFLRDHVDGESSTDFVHWAMDTETPETDLRDFSAATPYEFPEVSAAAQQLISFGKLG